MRKLARIEEIINIQPIENVDAIELANVKGWNVVVKKINLRLEISVFILRLILFFLTWLQLHDLLYPTHKLDMPKATS